MKNELVVGTQWGDEGKGKIVDLIAPDFDWVVRFQGGHNAGHTVVANGVKYALHLLPSGIIHSKTTNLIAHGVVVDPFALKEEIDGMRAKGIEVSPQRLLISDRAHLILPYHRALDLHRENLATETKIGTTGRGIGPAYEWKAARRGLRFCDVLIPETTPIVLREAFASALRAFPEVPELQQLDVEAQVSSLTETLNFLRPFIVDGVHALNNVVGKKRILFEGAQATLLDVDLGTYPFVTSSNASVAGLCAGTGIAPKHIHRVLGICKAYTTRVGEGPFPTELFDEHGTSLRNAGQEYGTTTGRPRRCGWLDLVALKHAVTVNGVDRLALMKLDVLNAFESISVCTAYRYQGKRLEAFPASSSVLEKVQPEYLSVAGWQQDLSHAGHLADLPKNCQEYLSLIEHYLKVPIGVISIGPDRRQTILRAL